jgi:hypothetical protein
LVIWSISSIFQNCQSRLRTPELTFWFFENLRQGFIFPNEFFLWTRETCTTLVGNSPPWLQSGSGFVGSVSLTCSSSWLLVGCTSCLPFYSRECLTNMF